MELHDADHPDAPPMPERVKGERDKLTHVYSLPAGVKPAATVLIVAGSDGTPYISWSNNLPLPGVCALMGSGLGVLAQVIAGDTKVNKDQPSSLILPGGMA